MRGHDAQPVPGSARRLSDREPANLLDVRDYPVLADCLVCGRVVRCDRILLADFYHVTEGDNQS
jgi:hypothetical protein